MTDVSLANLSKVYSGAASPAVDNVSMTIDSGSLTALIGPSGCGKSTILKMIAGTLIPTSGDILFAGQSALKVPPEKRDAVMMFQDHLLFPYMTVGENIGFGLKMRRKPKAEIIHAVERMLELVQLDGLGRRKPNQLSGGQRQRVTLARALVLHPKILLLDEPFTNLDANLRLEMQALLKSLHEETKTTMLFVTHDQSEAVALSSKIALILNGQLHQYDTPSALYSRPQDRSVAEFFGGTNFIPGHFERGFFDCVLGRFTLPDNCNTRGSHLTFRPESVIIERESRRDNCFLATIKYKKFLGSQTQLTIFANGMTFNASLPPHAATSLDEGTEVTVYLPRQSLWILP